MRKLDVPEGTKFGKWTTTGFECRDSKNRRQLEVSCICGSTQYKDLGNLTSGKSTQCFDCQSDDRTIHRINVGDTICNRTVLELFGKDRKNRKCRVRCVCGDEKDIVLGSLGRGEANSCKVCSGIERSADYNVFTPEYHTLMSMRARCNTPNTVGYRYYGGRGIKVCDRWMDPEVGVMNFMKDMGPRPSDNHSIDRIDSNGNYSPENCRWATRKEQALNRSCAIMLTYNGVIKNASLWAEERGINPGVIYSRVKKGMSHDDAINLPASPYKKGQKRKPKTLTFNGKTQSIGKWIKETGINKSSIHNRLKMGWSIEDTLTIPVGVGGHDPIQTLTLNGETKTIREWSECTGITKSAIHNRLNMQWPIEDILTKPVFVPAPPKPKRDPDSHKAKLTWKGETLSRDEWSKRTGIPSSTIRKRLSIGWSLDDTLTIHVGVGCHTPHGTHTYNGETKTVREWAEASGLQAQYIHRHLKQGWTLSDILNTPKKDPYQKGSRKQQYI